MRNVINLITSSRYVDDITQGVGTTNFQTFPLQLVQSSRQSHSACVCVRILNWWHFRQHDQVIRLLLSVFDIFFHLSIFTNNNDDRMWFFNRCKIFSFSLFGWWENNIIREEIESFIKCECVSKSVAIRHPRKRRRRRRKNVPSWTFQNEGARQVKSTPNSRTWRFDPLTPSTQRLRFLFSFRFSPRFSPPTQTDFYSVGGELVIISLVGVFLF